MDTQLKATIEKLLASDDVSSQEVGIRSLLHDEVDLEERYYILRDFLEKNVSEELSGAIHDVVHTLYPVIKKERINDL